MDETNRGPEGTKIPRPLETIDHWIRLNAAEGPVDGINMAMVTAFIQQGDAVLLYIGWTPEGKDPWLTLRGQNARRVLHWLARHELISF
jgi:hypothetical protein